MLEIDVPAGEFYDEGSNLFFETKAVHLRLEHSLVSISKWEAKWKKPFLSKTRHGNEELRDYVRCMTLNQNVDPMTYRALTPENLEQIAEYISADMTATTVSDPSQRTSREVVTSEIIYYWMVAYSIPWEAQKWHLSRLLMLIRVCSIKNGPQKKMSQREVLRRNSKLNAARRKRLSTRG